MHDQRMRPVPAEIADFQPEDQDEVRALILAGLAEHWGSPDETLNRDLDDIPASYGHGRTVVVRIAGQVVATGTIVPRDPATAEICRISVASTHRRRGLGRQVVQELLATARRWGATAVVLETTSDWTEVEAFHRSCGFAVTHRRPGEFGPDDTWFRHDLRPDAGPDAGPDARP